MGVRSERKQGQETYGERLNEWQSGGEEGDLGAVAQNGSIEGETPGVQFLDSSFRANHSPLQRE